jgi:RNA polymerase sigma-70 factor (ECF subfamily)
VQRISGHNTERLLTLAREGDESALDQLCRVYCERVRWMIRLRMGGELRSKLESMDVVQDALIHALGGLESFTYTNEGDFVRWLSTIVQHTLCEHWDRLHADKRNMRKEVRLRSLRSATGSGPAGMPGPVDATTPSVIMSRKEDLAKLEKALDSVKPEYREVLILSRIEGLSYGEIGQKLGKTPDAVRMLASRATAALATTFRRL